MKRISLAIGVLSVSFGSIAVGANACSSDDTTSTFVPDAMTGDVAPRDASKSDAADAATMPACFNLDLECDLGGPFNGVALAHQAACTSEQIADYLADCLPEKNYGVGADAGACIAWLEANEACKPCLQGPSFFDGGPYPLPANGNDSKGIAPNTSACIAALAGADPSCANAYVISAVCASFACETCGDADLDTCNAFGTAFFAPQLFTDGGADACLAAIGTVPAADRRTKCGEGEDFDTGFVAVATTLCGP